jgi:hypothetical protein
MAANKFVPVALAVHKGGRWRIVAKVTCFVGDSEPILAVAWRNQPGTRDAISLPVSVITHAQNTGAKRFFLRDDRRMAMFTGPLSLFEKGRLGADSERYIPIKWLQPAPWRDWAFAKQIVCLTNSQGKEKAGQQTLPGV